MRKNYGKTMEQPDVLPPIFAELRANFWRMLTEGNPEMSIAELQEFLKENEGLPYDYLFTRTSEGNLKIIPKIKVEPKIFVPKVEANVKPKKNPNQLDLF